MEFVNLWLPLIGVGIFGAIAVAAWFAEKKIAGIWFGFSGAVCLLLLIALQMQHGVEQAEARKHPSLETKPAPQPAVPLRSDSQRAWMNVSPRLVGQIKADAPIDIELVSENIGKEPAIGVNHHGVAMVFDMPEQLNYAPELWSPAFEQVIRLECDLAGPIQGRATVFPGDKIAVPIRWDRLGDIGGVIDRKKILVLYGCIGYFSGKDAHFTTYCFYLTADKYLPNVWRFGSGPIGNNAT